MGAISGMNYIEWLADNNPAGLLAVECCPLALYAERAQEVAIGDIRLTLANPWLTLYATVNTKTYSESEEPDSNGSRYNVKVSGFYPGDSQAIRTRLEYMRWHRWIVRAVDNMGVRRQAGDELSGLQFLSSFQIDATMSGDRGFRFEYSGDLAVRPMVLG